MRYKRCSNGGYMRTSTGAAKSCNCTSGFLSIVTFTGVGECCTPASGPTFFSSGYKYPSFNGLAMMVPPISGFSPFGGTDFYDVTFEAFTSGNCSGTGSPSSGTRAIRMNNIGSRFQAGVYQIGVTSGGGFPFDGPLPSDWATRDDLVVNNEALCPGGGSSVGGYVTIHNVKASATITTVPTSTTFSNAAGTGSFNFSVTAAAGDTIEWYASVRERYGVNSPDAWVTITSATSGTGTTGTITFSVAANATGSARSTTIVVNNVTYGISQAA